MGKNKLKKFAEIAANPLVLQPEAGYFNGAEHPVKNHWHELFGNRAPITLELGCGKGEYTVGQAAMKPNENFIGVDIKGARLHSGASNALRIGMKNVRFLRTRIDQIQSFFGPAEVQNIWVTFADPQPGKPRKRLTSEWFLERYATFLASGGVLHLKTDSDLLYESTLEEAIPNYNSAHPHEAFNVVFSSSDLYGEGLLRLPESERALLEIKTHYERLWLAEGRTIKYARMVHEKR